MNEKEAIERVEKYIKSFNGNALDCVAIGTVLTLLEKKDKIIDEMAKELVKAHEWFYSEFDNYTKEDFIKYFEKKAEEDKEYE